MRIVEHTRNNYGQLAVAFVRKIYENGVKRLKERYDTICSSIQAEMPSNGIAQGYGETITPIVLAAEIANSLGCMFDVDEIKNSLIEDFVINAERHESKLTQQQFEDKCIYEAIVKLAFIHCSEYAVDNQLLYVSTKKIDEVSEIFNCSSRKITSLLKAHGLLQEPESKNGKDRHSSYKGANGRYYLVKFDKSFSGIDDDNEMFKNNVIDKESIDAWLSENKNVLKPVLSPALAAKLDIKVVKESCKYLKSELYVVFTNKVTNVEFTCRYGEIYGTHDIQRKINSTIDCSLSREEFDEIQMYTSKIVETADLSIETIPSKREKLFIEHLKSIIELAGRFAWFIKVLNNSDYPNYSSYDSYYDATILEMDYHFELICERYVKPMFGIFYSGDKVFNCHELVYAINGDFILGILADSNDAKKDFVQNLLDVGLLVQPAKGVNSTKHYLFRDNREDVYALYGNKVKQLLKTVYAENKEEIPEFTMRFLNAENQVIKKEGYLADKEIKSKL